MLLALLGTACTTSGDETVELDPNELFAPEENRVSTIREAGAECDSGAAVDMYFDARAVRNADVVESLATSGSDEDIELRVTLVEALPWKDAEPEPGSGARVTGIGNVVTAVDETRILEARAGSPGADLQSLLVDQVDELVAEAQQLVRRQEAIHQDALDAGNQFMADRRAETLKDAIKERERVRELGAGPDDNGPMVSTLLLLGSSAWLSQYLNSLDVDLVYDAIIIGDSEGSDTDAASVPLVLTKWQNFSSVDELQSIFDKQAMLPMVTQLQAMEIERVCPIE